MFWVDTPYKVIQQSFDSLILDYNLIFQKLHDTLILAWNIRYVLYKQWITQARFFYDKNFHFIYNNLKTYIIDVLYKGFIELHLNILHKIIST